MGIEKALVIFELDQAVNGTINSPTKAGLVALAKLGKDAWNAWRRNFRTAPADFSGLNFKDDPINFSGFMFPGTGEDGKSPCVSFKNCQFGHAFNFSHAVFGDRADFSGTTFGDWANFSRTVFGSNANFSNSYFGDRAIFEHSKFDGWTSFYDSKFGHSANFKGVTLRDYANFRRAKFMGRSNFSASIDKQGNAESDWFEAIEFNGAEFMSDVRFSGRRFMSRTDFGLFQSTELESFMQGAQQSQATKFMGTPYFHGCKFHQDTSFDGAVFETPLNQEAARAFRTLKLAMEQLKATREEQRFFRLEMKAEHSSLPRGKRWISTLYNLFSDYGFSLWRPIVWLLALSLLFGTGYGLLANACAADSECAKTAWAANTGTAEDRTSAAIKYTLASVSPVPGLDRMQTELRAPLFGHHGWVPITALVLEILHKIIALVMVFLFALALRNLFKMKS